MVPESYKQAGLGNVVGGVLNVLTAGVWFISLIWVCVGILWLVPMALGAAQAWFGYQMHEGKPVENGKLWGIIGIVCGLFNFNPISTVASVLAMMKAGEPDSIAYLSSGGAGMTGAPPPGPPA